MYDHVKIVYVLFGLINLTIMMYSGVRIAQTKTNRDYWRLALIPIISYTLFMGLRFGRAIDFNVYGPRYYAIFKDFAGEDYELLFKSICYALNYVGIPYQGFILFCAFMIIFSVFFFVKDYKQAMPFMLFLFLWESINVENYIRWYLGVSFFLLFVYLLRKGKVICLLFGVAAIFTHMGLLALVAAMIALYWVRFVPFKPIVWQVLMVAGIFIGSTEILSFLTPYVSLLGIDERTTSYTEQFQNIIEGQFGSIGFRDELRFSTQIRKILAYSFPIYMIPKLIKEKAIGYLDANCYLIGIVIAPIFGRVEILDRISSGFLLFSMTVSGVSYWYLFKNRARIHGAWIIFGLLSLISNLWPVISGIIGRDDWWQMLFYWDANGREWLPTSYFHVR